MGRALSTGLQSQVVQGHWVFTVITNQPFWTCLGPQIVLPISCRGQDRVSVLREPATRSPPLHPPPASREPVQGGGRVGAGWGQDGPPVAGPRPSSGVRSSNPRNDSTLCTLSSTLCVLTYLILTKIDGVFAPSVVGRDCQEQRWSGCLGDRCGRGRAAVDTTPGFAARPALTHPAPPLSAGDQFPCPVLGPGLKRFAVK